MVGKLIYIIVSKACFLSLSSSVVTKEYSQIFKVYKVEEKRKFKIDPKVLDVLDDSSREKAAKKYGFLLHNNILFYRLNTTFPFGRHKFNQLSYVYKCNPSYIEWCMLHAEGFIIPGPAINMLKMEIVFCPSALEELTNNTSTNSITLDLRMCSLNQRGFTVSSKIAEKPPYKFSEEALQTNSNKIKEARLNPPIPETALMGGKWGNLQRREYASQNNVKFHIICS